MHQKKPPVETISILDLPVWDQAEKERTLLSVAIDLTARCNNDCVHCYINLPAGDAAAKAAELTCSEISAIMDQAVSLGALWVVLSGGEPLLRPDFFEIYQALKKKGLFVSVFTNASLVTREHIDLFRHYPPHTIEVTVYATTPDVHKAVTGKNTFAQTLTGIDLLLSANLPVTLKSTIMKANAAQLNAIAAFCRSRSDRPFRFDPFLQLRNDKNPLKNRSIKSQRLTPDEIVQIEQSDPRRCRAIREKCAHNIPPADTGTLFCCQAGINSCAIGFDGTYRLCPSLVHPGTTCSLKAVSLDHAWHQFTPRVLNTVSENPDYTAGCRVCGRQNICPWCPAHADLETNQMDAPVEYFCEIAAKREKAFMPAP